MGQVSSTVINVFDVLQPSAENHNSQPFVLLPQPRYPFSKSHDGRGYISNDIPGTYIQRTKEGEWFALSGKNYPSLVSSAPTAIWCLGAHDFDAKEDLWNSLVGVHPSSGIIQDYNHESANAGSRLIGASPTSALGIEAPSSPMYDNGADSAMKLDPQQPLSQSQSIPSPPTLSIGPPYSMFPWWHLVGRLIENVVTFLIITVVLLGAVRFGWLPQLTDLLEMVVNVTTARAITPVKVTIEDELVIDTSEQRPNVDNVSAEQIDLNRSDLDLETDLEEKEQQLEEKAEETIGVDTESAGTNDISSSSDQEDLSRSQELEPFESDSQEVSKSQPTPAGILRDEPLLDRNTTPTPTSKKVEILESAIDRSDSTTPVPISPVKRRKRGSRGGRKNNSAAKVEAAKLLQQQQQLQTQPAPNQITAPIAISNIIDDGLKDTQEQLDTNSLSNGILGKAGILSSPLTVTSEVLGYGSHGTVVLKGMFENREVAVKRMLLDFYDVASHEVSLLQESDDHPNVIRYFCKQQSEKFLYIALELCPGTLEDMIEKPDKFSDLLSLMPPIVVLRQIAEGVQYLHSLKIVHRDLKPQNILVAPPRKLHRKDINNQNQEIYGPVRMLISDFGLCKKLEGDQSSFRATTAHAAGTSGWRAPELLIDEHGENNGGEFNLQSTSDIGSSSEPLVIDSLSNRRATRAIDIFSLGCVFYYVLSRGQHPFGDKYLREANIVQGSYSLDKIDDLFLENSYEARDLVAKMISRDPRKRPDANGVLLHPFFWSAQKQLDFLLKVSDRLDKECRDPPSELLVAVEAFAPSVVGKNWQTKLDKMFLDTLVAYRKYHGDSIADLLRAMRNKNHHYNELPPQLQRVMSPLPEGFLAYFTKRFPNLLMTIYSIAKENLSDDVTLVLFFK